MSRTSRKKDGHAASRKISNNARLPFATDMQTGSLALCLPFLCFLSCTYFLDETFGSSPSVDDVEYITDVHTDATGQILCESNVATQGIPVAVESQSDKFAFAVETSGYRKFPPVMSLFVRKQSCISPLSLSL